MFFAHFDPFLSKFMQIWPSLYCRKYFEKVFRNKIFLTKLHFHLSMTSQRCENCSFLAFFHKKSHLNLILAPKSICWPYKLYLIFCKILWGFQKWYWNISHAKLWHHNDVIFINVFLILTVFCIKYHLGTYKLTQYYFFSVL